MSDTDDQGRPDDRRDPTAPPSDPGWAGAQDPSNPASGQGQDQPWSPPPPPPGETPGYGSPPSYPQPTYDQGAGAPPPPPPPPPGAAGPGGYPAAYQPPPAAYPGYQQPQQNTGALVLTIVSGATLLFCGGLLVIPALILGILGLTRQSTDPEGSQRMTRYGWWAYVAGVVVTILTVIVVVAVIIASSGSTSFDGY
jgi:hypothetical protein